MQSGTKSNWWITGYRYINYNKELSDIYALRTHVGPTVGLELEREAKRTESSTVDLLVILRLAFFI